ncbi:Hypothetical predicted protein [Cloeon dipterum]|uniref:Uncharacterized protein n=1 Tax=Cloeon dipterum TaxID=197152 RepID=A0A8S1CL68_9INSE|nr:Hypothetical predicted protein [Cloeon dipterum]
MSGFSSFSQFSAVCSAIPIVSGSNFLAQLSELRTEEPMTRYVQFARQRAETFENNCSANTHASGLECRKGAMAAVLESSYFRQRLRQMDNVNFHVQDNSRLGQCTVITVLAAGETHDYVFYTLGHMWLVGPIFICSGLMVAVKSVLYLRKKYLMQMLMRQRALWRELVLQARRQHQQQQYMARNASNLTLPPSYESIVVPQQTHIPSNPVNDNPELGATSLAVESSEVPPPTYEEAMILFGDEKLFRVFMGDEKCQPSNSISSEGHFSGDKLHQSHKP